jgi:hypothetical protein
MLNYSVILKITCNTAFVANGRETVTLISANRRSTVAITESTALKRNLTDIKL